ncbi:hypothetical protein RHGRI_006085 [Rhododendron griersonianum]|uniref:NLP1-9 GAF domain-containing protein n=1 Tax=Rhododendron griersonianum TaxID=479676 RepID=A0AAV6LHH6_9ERIC|nr:hypothetical protein RHGRI_006085 [Rhododendron griersonianum]
MFWMMPIDGSVDDVHTMLEVEEEEHFPPNFKEYIQKEPLSWSRFRDQDKCGLPIFGWVFWSEQDHQTQLGKSSLSLSLSLSLSFFVFWAQPQFSFTDNFADSIRHALQQLIRKEELRDSLVQFWAATKTSEGRTLLTTQFQPFALGPTTYTKYTRRLCEYRTGMCREYNNSFYADAECAEELLGLPGRVFLHQLPEFTPYVKYYSPHYTLKEYPQSELAFRCEIMSSWAVPVFYHSSHTCVGVLEIVSVCNKVERWHVKSFLGQAYDIFQEFGLLCFDGYKHYEMQIGDENEARTTAFQELKTVLKMVCEICELPLAMTWVPCSACDDLLRGQPEVVVEFQDSSCYNRLTTFVGVSKFSHLRKGGVAGMVLSPPNMLYCSDITQLSLAEYPLVPYARLCKFRGWFTLCLQSSHTANDIYVLEFFLPTSERYGDNSWTTLRLILGTMEENFRTFKLASGQKLGDLLSVEVMDFQKGQKRHSIQKIRAKGGGVMLQLHQLDQASTGAIHSGTNVVSEDQTNILPSLEAFQNGEVTMQLDSSHQPPLDPNNGQNVITAERNISIVTSSEERKRKTQREHKGTGVKIEVSLDDILEYSKKSRSNAAKKLQGKSTFPKFEILSLIVVLIVFFN